MVCTYGIYYYMEINTPDSLGSTPVFRTSFWLLRSVASDMWVMSSSGFSLMRSLVDVSNAPQDRSPLKIKCKFYTGHKH